MVDHFDADDIFKFDCEWMFLDTKKLSASRLPGAAILIFGIHMRQKMFKIFIKINKPKAKERLLTHFSWESIKRITISKKETIHELSLVLNKEKCNHSFCVVASTPEIFEKIYEVLNIVFFYLMNQRFKMSCAQMCKNIRILSSLETPRDKNNPGILGIKPERTLEKVIQGMLASFDKKNPGDEKPEETILPGNTIRLQLENNVLEPEIRIHLETVIGKDFLLEHKKSLSKNNKNSCANNVNSTENNVNSTENNVNSTENNMNLTEENMNVAEENMNVAEENMNVAEENMNVAEENMNVAEENMNVAEEGMDLEPEPNQGFDLYQILSAPSIVAIFFTLFVNLIYVLFFNPEM